MMRISEDELNRIVTDRNKAVKISEKEITHGIRNLLKTFRIFHWKNFGGPMGEKGVPDILGIYQGKFLGIEVKTPAGKLSDHQSRFLQNINDAGGIGFVARDVQTVIDKLGLQNRFLDFK